MLGKLIKHEWKAVSKPLIIMHLALILMAVIGKILLSIKVLKQADLLWATLLMVYILSVIAVGIGTQIYLAVRFYKNMYTDEGYLSFTLPVKPWEHIFSKTLISFIWILIDGIAIILSIFILVMYKGMGTEFIQEFSEMIEVFSGEGVNMVVLTIRMLLSGILSLVSIPLMYYFSISIGQLFNTHKMIASVVVYFITTNVIQVISAVVSALLMKNVSYMEEEIVTSQSMMGGFFNGIIDLGILGSILMCVGFWLVTNYIMNKRLNLE